jgi:ppGpp synthetase/RelA/SpoT-type nucleotidyltranferase
LVHFQEDRLDHIMTYEFKTQIVEQREDVLTPAGEEVVEADDIMAFADQSFTKMGTDKPGSACD